MLKLLRWCFYYRSPKPPHALSGFLPVNAHAEDNILNLNCINSFTLNSSTNRLSNGIQVIIEDHFVTFVSKLYIFIIYLYYRPFLLQSGNTSERPFCILIEAFVLDLQ